MWASCLKPAASFMDDILNLAVWVKTNAGQGSFYRSQHELVGPPPGGRGRITVFRRGGLSFGLFSRPAPPELSFCSTDLNGEAKLPFDLFQFSVPDFQIPCS